MPEPYESKNIRTNGIQLHTLQAGPDGAPLVLFLHGFPEFWRSWKKQMDPVLDEGYYVIAPDQRGYNLSEKPRGVPAYHLDETVKDVLGLILGSGREKAIVVGHDWGGIVAWWLALKYPGCVEKLVIANTPHPGVMRLNLMKNPLQMSRSLYALFFQIPWLPEAMLRKDDWSLLVQGLEKTSRPGTFSEEDIEELRQAWWKKGALTGMLNWYRANFRQRPETPPTPFVHVPTLMIWGKKDKALGPELVQPSLDYCTDGKLVMFEDASHWVQHEEFQNVTTAILDFLREKQ
jgi:epoxide hydrolase 4